MKKLLLGMLVVVGFYSASALANKFKFVNQTNYNVQVTAHFSGTRCDKKEFELGRLGKKNSSKTIDTSGTLGLFIKKECTLTKIRGAISGNEYGVMNAEEFNGSVNADAEFELVYASTKTAAGELNAVWKQKQVSK